MSSNSSASLWFESLKNADPLAAQRLWDRFSSRLIEHARLRLKGAPRGLADEEDIAQSVFRSIWRAAAAGRLNDITRSDELWLLLLAITRQKVIDYIRRESAQKRGAGRVKSEASLAAESQEEAFTLDWLIGHEPTPEFVVILDEQSTRLLGLLRDDKLRRVAISRIEGYSVPEIATNLAISTRSVERKLQLIRKTWAKELIIAN